jgi:hypothetical protein
MVITSVCGLCGFHAAEVLDGRTFSEFGETRKENPASGTIVANAFMSRCPIAFDMR